jgi:hypothetical protein
MADNPLSSGVLISWNFANWFTVVLMGVTFWLIVGAAQKVYQTRGGQ